MMLSAMALNEIYAIVFYIAALVCIVVGAYVFVINSSAKLNRFFWLISIALGIWAFSYSMISSSDTYEAALAWNRVSSVGWGLVYSLLLHYFLILSDQEKYLATVFHHWLLYSPALFVVYVFGINGDIATAEFELVKTSAGWANVSEDSLFDLIFYGYYVLYSALCLLALMFWWRKSEDRKVRKTVLILIVSFAISISIGGLTDVIFRSSMQEIGPQLGVVFAILPVFSVLYSVKKHGIMRPGNLFVDRMNGRVLSYEKRAGIYSILATVMIVGSFVYLLADYLLVRSSISSVILLSFFLFSLGIYIGILPSLNLSEKAQDLQLGLAMAVLTPLLTLYLYRDEYNNVIWALPIVLMIITTVFHNKSILIAIFVSAVVFESILFFSDTTIYSELSRSDYNQRIVLYFVTAGLVNFISIIYRQRLIENERQTDIQRQISTISSSFINVNESTLNDKIDSILHQSGVYLNMDRACLFREEKNVSTINRTNFWCAQGYEYSSDDHISLDRGTIRWILSELKKSQYVYIENVDDLPETAKFERELLKSLKIKTFMAVSITKNDMLDGILCYESYEVNSSWKPRQKEALLIIANILSDAISKVEAETKIHHLAYYDALTGLPNRASMKMLIEREIARSQKNTRNFGVLLYDLDEFKYINDSLGHDAGDVMIRSIASRLKSISGETAMVCRFGGDEFLTIIPNIDSNESLMLIAKRSLDVFKEPVVLDHQSFFISASCGAAVYPQDGLDVETLVRSADLAMYKSKGIGKNIVTFCTEELKSKVDDKTRLINDLYKAIENNELVLYYQPQIDLMSGTITGFEALLRWMHPERGLLPPGIFIPLAEQTELIHSIGKWVIKEACRQNVEWQDMGYDPKVMAVNLSVEQFRNRRLTSMIAEELAISRLAPEYLEIEITESIAISAPDYIASVLRQFKELGVSISIDDFGTEYSSLSRLKDLPIDNIKMAMEFVRGIGRSTRDEAIAASIINLAKSLGLKTIAEGVETEEQLKFLIDNVCELVQGFYFYRPMPAKDAEKLLKRENSRVFNVELDTNK